MTQPDSKTYKAAGVDIEAGQQLVERIKTVAARTRRPEVLAGLGGFGGLFELPTDRYQQPVLVSGTDGVGTKLKLATALDQHDTIGIDLVAMCVNDLIVLGAEPLFFLDYYATGKLSVDVAADVVEGIGKGCEMAGASLIGGETAEMPGMYQGKDYDLAGFCVGVVEKKAIIDGSQVKPGDALIGLASSGPHSNGFSLIRMILDSTSADLNMAFEGRTLGQVLLEPTRIYVKSILALHAEQPIHAIAHITGGGILENLPRVLPEDCQANIDRSRWTQPAIFSWLQEQGNIADEEMLKTFNCGIGMIICVPQGTVESALKILKNKGETATVIGSIEKRKTPDQPILISES